ncbi:hypothetical protein D3874_09465 [Oleomonas cavernae]|uniref:MmcQ/YjbR family DNA-binding protein n=1 Tax=Oleomonas cavernae TaxID=2320859 RepID=A0A418WB56_9PROT|nr:MmcQ/YjbR family DNA-binding protein [Oleomonas cavernae]RJF87229.1 hypothetical protein D3874_09465 [Oleomonas cavernae]
MTAPDLSPAFAKARKAAAGLRQVEESTWYGTPALKVGGKGFMRVKDAETLVLMCPLEEKELLIEAAPEIYFETDHYKGWAAILVRAARITDAELARRLEVAWRLKAPRRLLKDR